MAVRYRVGIIGAGAISSSHVEALAAVNSAEIVGIADVNLRRAETLARRAKVSSVYPDVAALLAGTKCNVAHVLVPPDLHMRVTLPLLEAGVHVLLEKPMATTTEECQALLAAAKRGNATLGINQTVAFHPTFLALKDLVESGRYGRVRHVVAEWNLPLPIEGPLTDTWMFAQPQNIFLELAIHPLAPIALLGGRPLEAMGLAEDPVVLQNGLVCHRSFQVSLKLERASAQLYFAVGQTFLVSKIMAICDDGSITADCAKGRLIVARRTPLIEHWEDLRDGLDQVWQAGKATLGNFTTAVLWGLRWGPQPYLGVTAMNNGIKAFYDGLDAGRVVCDGQLGADLVSVCEQATRSVARPVSPSRRPQVKAADGPLGSCDVAVFGGAGNIGRQTVEALARQGKTVRVVARNPAAAAGLLSLPGVQVAAADTERPDDVDRAVQGARAVVDLVFLKDGDNRAARTVTIAESVARACLRHGVERLVYTSSVEAVFMGDPRETILGSTLPDPRAGERDDYAQGKGDAELMLAALSRAEGLDVIVLRPGIVVGAGCPAFHPGVGKFVNDQFCINYGDGDAPLPFVLIDDVASAICLASTAPPGGFRAYNLVGDVRLTAQEYVGELGRILERPILLSRRIPLIDMGQDATLALFKLLAGRRDVKMPSTRLIEHLRMRATFDTSDLKRDLGWSPLADRAAFIERAIAIHARPRPAPRRDSTLDAAP